MKKNPNITNRRRNLWPAGIIGFFVIAVLFIVSFIAWAVHQREDLVSADYYEREVRFQHHLDSMNRSQSIASKTVVTFEPKLQSIIITLPYATAQNASGSIYLYRPSDARLDRELPLSLNADGVQHLDARTMSSGLWKVHVKWKADGQDYYLDQMVVVTSG